MDGLIFLCGAFIVFLIAIWGVGSAIEYFGSLGDAKKRHKFYPESYDENGEPYAED